MDRINSMYSDSLSYCHLYRCLQCAFSRSTIETKSCIRHLYNVSLGAGEGNGKEFRKAKLLGSEKLECEKLDTITRRAGALLGCRSSGFI